MLVVRDKCALFCAVWNKARRCGVLWESVLTWAGPCCVAQDCLDVRMSRGLCQYHYALLWRAVTDCKDTWEAAEADGRALPAKSKPKPPPVREPLDHWPGLPRSEWTHIYAKLLKALDDEDWSVPDGGDVLDSDATRVIVAAFVTGGGFRAVRALSGVREGKVRDLMEAGSTGGVIDWNRATVALPFAQDALGDYPGMVFLLGAMACLGIVQMGVDPDDARAKWAKPGTDVKGARLLLPEPVAVATVPALATMQSASLPIVAPPKLAATACRLVCARCGWEGDATDALLPGRTCGSCSGILRRASSPHGKAATATQDPAEGAVVLGRGTQEPRGARKLG